MTADHYIGQRLSLSSLLVTVRYIGPVQGTKGTWLGIEYDDPRRGKHRGEHDGVKYFECRSKNSTPGSFVRPGRPNDTPLRFLDALRKKYAAKEEFPRHGLHTSDSQIQKEKSVEWGGKLVEEVGFEKIRRQLAALSELKIVLLDGMCVASLTPDARRHIDKDVPSSLAKISQVCPKIVELDLGRNLLERWQDVIDICGHLKHLKSLRVSGNRFSQLGPAPEDSSDRKGEELLDNVEELDLDENLLEWEETSNLLKFSKTLTYVDLSQNSIGTWAFIDELHDVFPGLNSLRVSHNPLYDTETHDHVIGIEEGFMLTAARLENLQTLNFSTITPPERSNAELYYLSRIAKALAAVPETEEASITSQHPRYASLCELYGAPTIPRAVPTSINPASLEASLINFEFHLSLTNADDTPLPTEPRPQTLTASIPRTFSMYRVKGLVGRLFAVKPLATRLVWETGEWDPVEGYVPDEEEDDDGGSDGGKERSRERWRRREVELEEGTREVGFWVEEREARVRVEVRD
ncbi:MAG: hypothetical protein M1833_001060 [Piccolia ochrophora]|nr:MAG: hypothetical protein M1833_001060 [Piccolia ochrophora]